MRKHSGLAGIVAALIPLAPAAMNRTIITSSTVKTQKRHATLLASIYMNVILRRGILPRAAFLNVKNTILFLKLQNGLIAS